MEGGEIKMIEAAAGAAKASVTTLLKSNAAEERLLSRGPRVVWSLSPVAVLHPLHRCFPVTATCSLASSSRFVPEADPFRGDHGVVVGFLLLLRLLFVAG